MITITEDIKNCLTILKNGGVILYPTDTIWGIGCDATNIKAVEKIYQIKKRPDEKAMLILLANENELKHYIKLTNTIFLKNLKQQLKPTTFIYNDAKNLAKNLINKDGSVAIRIVQDNFCKQLITALGKPIVSTSANISGTAYPNNFTEIKLSIKDAVDYVVTYRQDDLSTAKPSAIKKWNADGSITTIRS